MEGTSTCESDKLFDSEFDDIISSNVEEATELLNDGDVDNFDDERAIAALFKDLLQHVGDDDNPSNQDETGGSNLFSALLQIDNEKQEPVQEKVSLRKRSRCRVSRSQDDTCPPKRSKRKRTPQKAKEISSGSLLEGLGNTECVVKQVAALPSPQPVVPSSPVNIPQLVPITSFNATALLPPSGGAPAFQMIQTHPISPTNSVIRILPADPTFIFVPATPTRQIPQIVPLSPVSGTVAPELLVMSPGSSQSDTVNSATVTVKPIEPPLLNPGSPLSECGGGTAQGDASSRPQGKPRLDPLTIAESNTLEADASKKPKQVENEPSVERCIQHVKGFMKESHTELAANLSMKTHYIDVPLLQRKVLVQSGKNANKCLEKEMVMLTDTERKRATLTRKQAFGEGRACQRQVVALLGKPGLGKSTFIRRLCLDWAEGDLPNFRFVFSLNCKTLNHTQADYSLKKLLFHLPTSPHCDNPDIVFKSLVSAPEQGLIILDSFEDFRDHEGMLQSPATCSESGGFSIKQLLSGLFLKRLLKGCTVLISTRPNGALTPLLRKVDVILELCGFSPVEIDLYTSLYFTDVPRGATALTKMKLQKYIYSWCSVPLVCYSTCFLLQHLDSKRFVLPSTLTGLMMQVLSQFLPPPSADKETLDIPRLCSLAWELLNTHGSLVKKEQFDSEDISSHGVSRNMLTPFTVGSNDCSSSGSEETTSYSFAHAFVQYLLASLHLVLSDGVSDKALVHNAMSTGGRRRRPQAEWQGMVQHFTTGLLFQSIKLPEGGLIPCSNTSAATTRSSMSFSVSVAKRRAVEAHLESLKSGAMPAGKLLELCHCVYETNSKKLMKQLVKNLPDTINLCGAQLTPPDVYVFWHLLEETRALRRQFCIDLKDTGISLSGLQELVSLSCVTTYRAPLADTIALWEELQQEGETELLMGIMDKLTLHPFKATQEDHVRHLAVLTGIHQDRDFPFSSPTTLEHDIPAIRQLEKLDYELGPRVGPTSFSMLAKILPSLKSLQHLDLEKNKIGDIGAELLAKVLNSLSSLKMLNLSQNSIGDKGLESLAPALAGVPSLQRLSLYDNLIAEGGAAGLAGVLPEMLSLIDIDDKPLSSNIPAKMLCNSFIYGDSKSSSLWEEGGEGVYRQAMDSCP